MPAQIAIRNLMVLHTAFLWISVQGIYLKIGFLGVVLIQGVTYLNNIEIKRK